jgi:hypothetical protein
MVQLFITDLLHGIFLSHYSIITWVGIALNLLLFCPSSWGDKMNNFVKKWIRPYALYIFPWFIVVSVILTSYSMYKDAHQDINAKKEQIIGLQTKLDIERKNNDSSLKTQISVGGIVGYVEGGAGVNDCTNAGTINVTTNNP